MVLSRLFLAGERIHFHRKEFTRQTRRICSSSSSSSLSSKSSAKLPQPKKAEAAKEQRVVAVETFVKNYMQMHPGVFPKASQVQKEVGGSWKLLKGILTELRESMSNNPHIQTLITCKSLDATVDTTDSEAIKAGERLGTTELEEPNSRVQPAEGVTDSHNHEKSSGVLTRSEDSSQSAKINERTDDCQQSEANSSTVVTPGTDPEAISELLSCLQGRLVSKDKASSSDEVTSVENEQHPPHKAPTFLTLNDSFKTKDKSSLTGSVKNILGLADLHMRRKMDATEADDDTLTHETSSDVAKATSGDSSMKRQDIMSLIDRIKDLPNRTSQTKSNDPILSSKINWPTHRSQVADTIGGLKLSNQREQHKSLHELFIGDKLEKPVLQKEQNEVPNETNLFTSILQNMDKRTPTKSDDCVTCNGNNLRNDNEAEPTKKVPFKMFDSQFLSDDESASSSNNDAASNYTKTKPILQIPVPYKKVTPKKDSNPFLFTVKGRDQTTVLVRFLRKLVTVTDIKAVFGDFGPIDEISLISSTKESMFRDAYVSFKTKEGLQRALAKTDVVIRGKDVVIEATRPSANNMSNRIFAPNLIGDPDVPTGLLENPTHSVMVKGLPPDLTLHHLREALSCGASISGFCMGSSSSVAYIEFETEDAKEKAIAESSVSISGKLLSILRIDAPRTTIVRISNVFSESGGTTYIRTICSLHGQVKRVVSRGADIFDVHFNVSEWPNMVNILNSLNGKVVNEHQWIAQPATVIPVEILRSLWSQPDGRMHVNSLIRNLCGKVEENLSGVAKISQIAAQYYGERA